MVEVLREAVPRGKGKVLYQSGICSHQRFHAPAHVAKVLNRNGRLEKVTAWAPKVELLARSPPADHSDRLGRVFWPVSFYLLARGPVKGWSN